MRKLRLDPSNPELVVQHLACSKRLLNRRVEFAFGVTQAYAIVHRFATAHGWQEHMREPLFTSVRIYETQRELLKGIRRITGSADRYPPTDGLSAALFEGTLMAVTSEEYERIRPEYAHIDQAWVRLLAHEMVHPLHVRLVGTEEKMGPQWFYEGFAMYAAGQHFAGPAISLTYEAVEATHAESRGSYAKYIAAFAFFVERIDLCLLLQRAAEPGLESWLIEEALRFGES